MAKARKKASPAAKAAKSARNAQAKTQANPFELKGVRRHFAVVGQDRPRRSGGGGKSGGGGGIGAVNVVKARENADLRRKKTLLVEYRQIRRGNAFTDRRLGARMGGDEDGGGGGGGGERGGGERGGGGERDDPEARALLKLRAQRVRDSRRGASKFALGGGDDDGGDHGAGGEGFLGLGASASLGGKQVLLTHAGRPLDDGEDGGEDGGGGGGGGGRGRDGGGADGFLQRRRAEDEEDERVLDELAREYRAFGGPGLDDEDYAAALEGARQQLRAPGGGGGGGEDGGGGHQRPEKTRKEVMGEVMAKSKAFKAERARQREADEGELRRLNESFTALVRGGGEEPSGRAAGSAAAGAGGGGGAFAPLMLAPGEARAAVPAGATGAERADADAYDSAARELALAAGRAAPGERTLSTAERQSRERGRLEALERARVARMLARASGGGDDGAEAAAAAAGAPAGGYAARRKRQRDEEAAAAGNGGASAAGGMGEGRPQGPSGDALEDDFCLPGSGSSDGEDGGDGREDGGDGDGGSGSSDGGEDGPGAPAAANALEARRRARAAGSDPLQAAFREQAARLAAKYGVGGGGGEEDEEGNEDEDEDDEDEDGSGSGGEGESGSASEEAAGGSDDDDDDDEPPPPPKPVARPPVKKAADAVADANAADADASADADAAPEDLPFTPALPQSPEAFLALVKGRPAEHLALAVERVLAFNAAELAADGRRKTQVRGLLVPRHYYFFFKRARRRDCPRRQSPSLREMPSAGSR